MENYTYLLLLLSRLTLAFVFSISSFSKLQHPRIFISAVNDYHLLPETWVRPFTTTLPWLEMTLGLMLLLGWSTRIGGYFQSAD